jgi:GNAT superfamily N-acetyltransferase
MRVATDGDVPALTQLINAAFVVERPIFDHDRIDDAGVRDYMTRGKFLLYENPENSESAVRNPVACVYLETNFDRRCYLGLLSVLPEHQGKSLAPKILKIAEDFARNANCHTIWLRTLSARVPPLRSFYERFGYKLLDITPVPDTFHPQIPCEFVVMEKRLA